MTPRTVTLRSRTGSPKGEATLLQTWDLGLQATHNADGQYRKMVGMDADGLLFKTTSSGNWTQVWSEKESADLTVRIWGPDAS